MPISKLENGSCGNFRLALKCGVKSEELPIGSEPIDDAASADDACDDAETADAAEAEAAAAKRLPAACAAKHGQRKGVIFRPSF